jgi:hypothetical protein
MNELFSSEMIIEETIEEIENLIRMFREGAITKTGLLRAISFHSNICEQELEIGEESWT